MVADRLPPTLGHLVCPVLVDREAELAALWPAVQRAAAGVGGSVVGAPGWRESGKRLVREAADVNAALTCVLVLRNAPPTPWLPKEMHGRRLRGDSTAGYAQYHAAFPAFATIVGELSSWGLSIAFAANTITVVAVCARDGSSSRLYGCSSQS